MREATAQPARAVRGPRDSGHGLLSLFISRGSRLFMSLCVLCTWPAQEATLPQPLLAALLGLALILPCKILPMVQPLGLSLSREVPGGQESAWCHCHPCHTPSMPGSITHQPLATAEPAFPAAPAQNFQEESTASDRPVHRGRKHL